MYGKARTGPVCGLLRASFYHGAKIRNSAVLPLAGNLLGSAFPKPCYAACAAYPRRAHAARKEVTTMRKKYNTPHRSRVVKTRLTEDEYADFTARLAPYGISQSEFLRQAIRRTTIRPVLHVSSVTNPGENILPGRYTSVEISKREIKDALAIPSEAVIPEMGKDIVYLYKNGVAEPQEITIGIRTESRVQVLQGLNVGDTLITSGVMQLRTGMKVSIDNLTE